MRLKPGVRFGSHVMALCFAAQVAESVYQKYGHEFIITSVNDGRHMDDSKHFTDEALDSRTKHIQDEYSKKLIASEIKESLGEDFDVILESLGGDNEHLHIEYDPK